MRYNNSDSKQSGRRNFGRRDFGSPGMARQMYKAVCSNCGNDCQVPFEPTSGKPVYCSECFEKNRGVSDTRRFEGRNFNKPHFEDRNNRPSQNSEQYSSINIKLDKILAILTPNPSAKVVSAPKPDLPLPSKDAVIIAEKKKKPSKKVVLPPEA